MKNNNTKNESFISLSFFPGVYIQTQYVNNMLIGIYICIFLIKNMR